LFLLIFFLNLSNFNYCSGSPQESDGESSTSGFMEERRGMMNIGYVGSINSLTPQNPQSETATSSKDIGHFGSIESLTPALPSSQATPASKVEKGVSEGKIGVSKGKIGVSEVEKGVSKGKIGVSKGKIGVSEVEKGVSEVEKTVTPDPKSKIEQENLETQSIISNRDDDISSVIDDQERSKDSDIINYISEIIDFSDEKSYKKENLAHFTGIGARTNSAYTAQDLAEDIKAYKISQIMIMKMLRAMFEVYLLNLGLPRKNFIRDALNKKQKPKKKAPLLQNLAKNDNKIELAEVMENLKYLEKSFDKENMNQNQKTQDIKVTKKSTPGA